MKPIPKTSITDQVVSNLKEHIESNDLKEGDKLPTEAALCEMLGVSRTTIREATRILQALGYVEVRHGRGIFIKKQTDVETINLVDWYKEHKTQIIDIIEVRKAIEPLATRTAIERITDKDIRDLERIHRSYEKACEDEDQTALCTLSEHFHNKIVEITHNKLLVCINKIMADAFLEFRCRGYALEAGRLRSVQCHKRIMDAIRSRNAEKGAKEMSNHIDNVLQTTLELIEMDEKNK